MRPLPVHIGRAIDKFDEAARKMAFKGAAMPEEHKAIEHQYRKARERLEHTIQSVLEKR